LLLGMRNWVVTLQSSSRIRLLLSGSFGIKIGPNLVPARPSLHGHSSRLRPLEDEA
jgi:hypothetical protein